MSRIYGAMGKELSVILSLYKSNPNPNVWHRNKAIRKRVEAVMAKYRKVLFSHIANQSQKAWNLSDSHNDDLVGKYIKGISVPDAEKSKYYQRNQKALDAFIKRKSGGYKLSERVWNLTNSTQAQMETFISEGLADGRPAAKLARDLKQYLNNPDKRFRRIRDPETGKLKLSKPGKNYHPGRGVYRSSYKNALRLARNEINIAYRSADVERRKKLPFVLGIKVNLSPAHPQYDICDELQGEYPKNFVFTGWHTNCLCFTTSKLISKEEFIDYLNGKGLPQSKEVVSIPKRAGDYLNDNADKIKKLSSKPYFIADNFKSTKDGFQLKKEIGVPGSAPAKKAIPIKNPADSEFIPDSLSAYESKTGIEVDKSIFSYLKAPIPLNPKGARGKGGYYSPSGKFVHAPVGSQRNRNSKWHAESLIYHEYGHAIDWQNNLRNSRQVKDLMKSYRQQLRKESNQGYKSLNDKIRDKYQVFRSKSNYDGLEKLAAFADSLMSLNPAYGFGHSKTYFGRKGAKQAEFIAHAFENKFIGNDIFKELAPEMYVDMIKMVNDFKPK